MWLEVELWAWGVFWWLQDRRLGLGEQLSLAQRLARSLAGGGRLVRRDRLRRRSEGLRRLPGGRCLQQALAVGCMLSRRGEDVELVVGFRRGVSGEIEGHAWLTAGGEEWFGAGYQEVHRRQL